MNPQIEVLKELQNLDTKFLRIKRTLIAGPLEIKKQQHKIDELSEKIAEQEQSKKYEISLADSDALESEKLAAEIEDLKKKMNVVKNSKEYQIIRRAIDEASAEKDEFENSALEKMEQTERFAGEIETLRQNIGKEKESIKALNLEINNEAAELKKEAKLLKSKRELITAKLEKEILQVYEDVLRTAKGVAVVAMHDGICQGCFIQQSPDKASIVEKGDTLERCRECGRFLFYSSSKTGSEGD